MRALRPPVSPRPALAMRAWLRYFGLGGESAVERTSPTTIGTAITLKGELQGDGALIMLGRFEGVHVGTEGRLVVVAGVVRGNLWADRPAQLEERQS